MKDDWKRFSGRLEPEGLTRVLDDLQARAEIGDAALEWRRSLIAGRFNEAADHLTTTGLLAMAYLETHEATDNPGDTGVHPDGSDADAAGHD